MSAPASTFATSCLQKITGQKGRHLRPRPHSPPRLKGAQTDTGLQVRMVYQKQNSCVLRLSRVSQRGSFVPGIPSDRHAAQQLSNAALCVCLPGWRERSPDPMVCKTGIVRCGSPVEAILLLHVMGRLGFIVLFHGVFNVHFGPNIGELCGINSISSAALTLSWSSLAL